MMHSRYRRARTLPEVWDARPLSLQVIFTLKSAPEVQLSSIPRCPPALSTVACRACRAARSTGREGRTSGGQGAGRRPNRPILPACRNPTGW